MSGRSAFVRLDDLARFPSSSGFTLVHAEPALLGTLARHLARRALGAGRATVCIDAVSLDEPWRELGRALEVQAGDDPLAVARALWERAGSACALVCVPRPSAWGGAVADELARLGSDGCREGWVVELSEARRCPCAEPLVVAERLEPQDRERWWQALWHERSSAPSSAALERLDQLERWWLGVRGAAPIDEGALSEPARRLLARIALCGSGVAPALRAKLGSAAAAAELDRQGFVSRQRDGRIAARVLPRDPSPDDALAVGTALEGAHDGWDRLRASALLMAAGQWERAADRAEEVLDDVSDACARADLWSRWRRALAGLDRGPVAGALLQRFSAVALRLGDLASAMALAEQAAAVAEDPEAYGVLLCLGRATAARGEHAAAAQALELAAARAPTAALRAEASVELAEVCCARGLVERAEQLARAVLGAEHGGATGLAARNVLGKLLLAAGGWETAERHFAQDAQDAARLGQTEARLRAELNRGTALLMGGRHSEARARFEAVLDGAREHGALRAEAFALSNLAVLACYEQDYAGALGLREQAIRVFRRLGHRPWLARSMTYLADLRIDLGLIDEADQGLAFARRVLGQALRPTEAAFMGYVASRIHLARGDTAKAAAAIADASASAERSADGSMTTECCCQAARVALADRDLPGAAEQIARASAAATTPGKQAELALLRAHLARAAGEPWAELAALALERARSAADRRRAAAAQHLRHQAALAAGDAELARHCLSEARRIHEGIAGSLPDELAARYRAFVHRTALGGPPPTAASPSPSAPPRRRRTGLVGSHRSIQRLRDLIDKIAPTATTVLIRGESGTGKELVADAIHQRSRRRAGPLVKVNCAALVETLLLSELFGHEKGAFTGASCQHRGCFEHAEGGTIFLDEIGDLSAPTQAALLRVLQDRTFHRVGGTELVRVDVRVVCATHRDLAAMVESGAFREDLFYRLREVELVVPPLRERLEDLPLLCAELLLRIAREQNQPLKRLSADALALLSAHRWPGNVRELHNALRAAALFADGDTVTADELRRQAGSLRTAAVAQAERPAGTASPPAQARDQLYAAACSGAGLRDVQKQLELYCIVKALRETGGHITRAAALLGIKRPRLSQLIKEHDLKGTEE